MQLSKRLSAVAEFVTPGGCLVDVGTDHGWNSKKFPPQSPWM